MLQRLSIIDRVRNILITPRTEWLVIERESASVVGLYKNYIAILAVIPALASFGNRVLFLQLGIFSSLLSALTLYVLSLIAAYATALLINWLAPNFGGFQNQIQAFKVVAYSFTASWVADAGLLFPVIGTLTSIAGSIYSYYLLSMGMPLLMQSSVRKAPNYILVVVLFSIVLNFINNNISNSIHSIYRGYGLF
jgi:hypothetical protein